MSAIPYSELLSHFKLHRLAGGRVMKLAKAPCCLASAGNRAALGHGR